MIRALLQGPAAEHPIGVGGVTLAGVNGETLLKLVITVGLLIVVALLSRTVRAMIRWLLPGSTHERAYFWSRQAIRIVAAALVAVGIISIWVNDPSRLATVAGFLSAGVAI